MGRQRLREGATVVDFYAKIRRPDIYFEARNEAIDGTLFIYELAEFKKFYELRLNIIPSVDAGIINVWTRNKTTLIFAIDQDDKPIATIDVKIVNESRPLQMGDFDYDTYYTGTIFVREV